MSTADHRPGNADKIEGLRAALAEFQRQQARGQSTLFDPEVEEAKAEVRRRALLLLDQRARSTSELRSRLLDLDLEAATVDEVIGDLTRAGLLDDEHFASEWVRQRSARRGRSSRMLDKELQDKGVAPDVRQQALAQLDSDTERATAEAIAVKKARSENRLPEDRADYDKALRRVLGALARRGFPAGMSMELARAALDARFEELDS